MYDLGPRRKVALASFGGGMDKTMTLDFAAQTVIKTNYDLGHIWAKDEQVQMLHKGFLKQQITCSQRASLTKRKIILSTFLYALDLHQ